MKVWEKFHTFKQRGEWIELKFMAKAAEHGLQVLKPMGDSFAYDVALDSGYGPSHELVRVQVKSTTCRAGYGYLCRLSPNPRSHRQYSADQIDFFAAYVIPKDVWYLIPSAVLFENGHETVSLSPSKPRYAIRYRYERYKEAWPLLAKARKVQPPQGMGLKVQD